MLMNVFVFFHYCNEVVVLSSGLHSLELYTYIQNSIQKRSVFYFLKGFLRVPTMVQWVKILTVVAQVTL